MVNPYKFKLLSRSCVSPEEYDLKILYLSLSVVAIAFISIVLLRIAIKRWRRAPATSIGRLVEHLLIVQGAFDICYHLVDTIFSLDCDAPPLFTLLTTYSTDIYARPTIAYNTTKEGLGYLSLLWHAHVAKCMYSWIVLKVSAVRLRRRRIPVFVLATAAMTGFRYCLYHYIRRRNLGLYLSSLVFDMIVVPGTVAVMLRYYCLTVQALGAQPKSDELTRSQHRAQLQQQQGREEQEEHGSAEQGELNSAGNNGGGSSGVQVSQGGGSDLAVSSSGGGGAAESGTSGGKARSGSGGGAWTTSSLLKVRSFSWQDSKGHGQLSGQSGNGTSRRHKARNKNMAIIRRLTRISLSVSLVWLLLAGVNTYIWFHFRRHGEVSDLSGLLILRLILLRMFGTIDAIFLGDLFALCRPCYRSLARAWARLWPQRQRAQQEGSLLPMTLPLVSRFVSATANPGPGSPGRSPSLFPTAGSAVARNGNVSSAVASCVSGAPAEPPPPQQQRWWSVRNWSYRRSSSSVRGAGSVGSSGIRAGYEEEAAAMAWKAEEMQRLRAPKRPMRTVELFVSSWNMGGVDRECCTPPDDNGSGSGKSALQLVIPLWLPRGYDLYVIGVQECLILNELREAILEHLGGPEAYTVFGKDIGSEMIHGRIATTLFVRTPDVARGHFHMHRGVVDRVAAGVSLGPLGRAENKGMVGLSFKYGDATLAIISAHFASDSHGRNKVAKRNAHACTTLRELSLHWDNDDFNAHLQHHHTILLGDLNYRCRGTPQEVLARLSRTATQLQQHAAAMAPMGSHWRALSYAQLFQDPLTLHFPLEAPPPKLPPCLAANRSRHRCPLPFISKGSSVTSSSSVSIPMPNGGVSFLSGAKSVSQLSIGVLQAASAVNPDEADEEEEEEEEEEEQGGQSNSPPAAPLNPQQQHSSITWNVSEPSVLSPWPTGVQSGFGSGVVVHGGGAEDGGVWGWARRADELSRSMEDRLVFSGFQEAPLHFPPSYRWQRVQPQDYLTGEYVPGQGGLAGDYADEGRLKAAAYSTFVPDKPGFFPSFSTFSLPRVPSDEEGTVASTSASPRHHRPRTPNTLMGMRKASVASGGTHRTPSWTDRVLTHSLPGKGSLLRWRAYDMADDVGLSDHRPVASHLCLLVDAEPPPLAFKEDGGEEGEGGRAGDLALFHITIPKPPVVTLPKKGSVALSSSHEVSLLFPLTGEDPIAEQRKASSLGEVMSASPAFTSTALQRGSSISSLSHFTLGPTAFPIRVRTVASLRHSEHLLLKICEGHGYKELGQACIPIALFLPTPKEPTAGHRSATPPPPVLDSEPTAATTVVSDVEAGGGGRGEVVEGTGAPPPQQQRRRGMRFPLTSGGKFRGWISLDMRVRVTPLRESS